MKKIIDNILACLKEDMTIEFSHCENKTMVRIKDGNAEYEASIDTSELEENNLQEITEIVKQTATKRHKISKLI